MKPDESVLLLIERTLKPTALVQTRTESKQQDVASGASPVNLQIVGTNDSYVVFEYTDRRDNLTQKFGVTLKKYISHTEKEKKDKP